MISVNIYAFALALVVVACAATVWRIYYLQKAVQAAALSIARVRDHCEKVFARIETRLQKVEQQSPVALAARVDELTEAVERLRKTHQRFAGRIDQQRARRDPEPASEEDDVDDPTWLALRRAQHIPQGPPNGSTVT